MSWMTTGKMIVSLVCFGLLLGCETPTNERKKSHLTASQTPEVTSDVSAKNQETTPCGPSLGKDVCYQLSFDGKLRYFWLHLPEELPSHPPLVIGLHGLKAGPNGINSLMGIRALADARHYVALLPVALEIAPATGLWKSFTKCCRDAGGLLTSQEQQFWNELNQYLDSFSDVDFLKYLIDFMVQEHSIDSKKIYVIGHSNGGMMAYKLACEASELISAVISLAGTLESDTQSCRPSTSVAVMHLHSPTDTTIPFNGGPPGMSAIKILATGFSELLGKTVDLAIVESFFAENVNQASAQATVDRWGAVNHCQSQSVAPYPAALLMDSQGVGPDSTLITFQGCTKGTEFVVLSEKAQHTPLLDLKALQKLMGDFLDRN